MKKFFCTLLIFCIALSGISASAMIKKQINLYTIEYVSGSDTMVASSTVSGYSEVLEGYVSKVRPRKEGYTFRGWAFSEQDYTNAPIFQPGDEIKISSSVKLYALWEDKNIKKLMYLDGPNEIFPSQLVMPGEVKITEMIPKKDGYVFSGWSYSGPNGRIILKPGDVLNVEKESALSACWEKGDFSLPVPKIMESISDAVVFYCENIYLFDDAILKVQSLADDEQATYAFQQGHARVDDLDAGAYKAWIIAEKYGIEYKSESVNFVVPDSETVQEGSLTVFMDGRKLIFDLPPVIIEGHTFVTLRYFCEYLGANVLWDDVSRTAIITYNGIRMKIKENSDICVVNGATYTLPAKTVIMSSRLMIPLRSIAEFCNCHVVWDPSKKVYMFSEQVNPFDRNMFSISGNTEKFMSLTEGELKNSATAEPDSVWIFEAVDAEKGIYEIYNFYDMTKPLEVKTSRMLEGQPLRVWEKSGYDGYLWKVTKCDEGEFLIQPANNEGFYLDAANLCITADETKVFLDEAYR